MLVVPGEWRSVARSRGGRGVGDAACCCRRCRCFGRRRASARVSTNRRRRQQQKREQFPTPHEGRLLPIAREKGHFYANSTL